MTVELVKSTRLQKEEASKIIEEDILYESSRSLNNSSLRWLKSSPKTFKKVFIDNEKPDEGDQEYFVLGSLIHTLLLQPQIFDYKYQILDYVKPANRQQEGFAKEVAISDLDNTIIYRSYYSCDKKSDSKIKEEADKLEEQLKDYIEFIKTANTKTVISTKQYEIAKSAKKTLFSHKKAKELLFFDDKLLQNSKEVSIFVERPFYFKYKGIDCKMKIDKVIIDNNKKKIILIDLKTTSKPVLDFKDSFDKYDYGRQFAFYKIGLQCEYPNHSIECYNIVLNTIDDESMVFKIGDDVIDEKTSEVNELLDDYLFYIDKGFEHHKSYYENDGIVFLTLN